MTTPLIPWPVFFQALQRQRATLRHAWLCYWMFSDDGAALKLKDSKPESLSLEEEQKRAVLFLMTMGEAPKTIQ